jgi:hypothetical protein
MSDAFFYKGFDFEYDVSGLLTIEGQHIPVVQVDRWFESPIFPCLKGNSGWVSPSNCVMTLSALSENAMRVLLVLSRDDESMRIGPHKPRRSRSRPK